jgi:hypothetical protein
MAVKTLKYWLNPILLWLLLIPKIPKSIFTMLVMLWMKWDGIWKNNKLLLLAIALLCLNILKLEKHLLQIYLKLLKLLK